MSAAEADAPRTCTFRVGQRGEVWYVTRERVFYGDYNTKAQAIAAACFGARAAEAQGAKAAVLDGPDGTAVPHKLPPKKKS